MQELKGFLSRVQNGICRVLQGILSNEGLFLLLAFFYASVLCTDEFVWYRDDVNAFYQYVVVPWGMALCLFRLQKCSAAPLKTHGDVKTLTVLYLWMVVPFWIRFGLTAANLNAWFGYAVMFFGVYASISEMTKEKRQNLLALTSGLFTVFSLIWNSVLLYCALSGHSISASPDGIVFGVVNGCLSSGAHYNITGMVTLCLCMMSLIACGCAKNPALKAVCILSAVMSSAVIVLTQSRTSRYALLIALALGAFDLLYRALEKKGKLLSMGIALVCAAVVLVGGYKLCAVATDAALAHYARLEARQEISVEIIAAEPEFVESVSGAEGSMEIAAEPEPAESISGAEGNVEIEAEPEIVESISVIEPEESAKMAARPAVDSTFSERTLIWKNVFKLWKKEPKMMIIGNGVGRTGSKIVEGTVHEATGAVAVHNSYLQWAADYGLIGFVPEVIFLFLALKQTARVFFAKKRERGALALCMMVLAALAVGMMESATLNVMTPMNMVFMFSLAQLAGMSREIAQ